MSFIVVPISRARREYKRVKMQDFFSDSKVSSRSSRILRRWWRLRCPRRGVKVKKIVLKELLTRTCMCQHGQKEPNCAKKKSQLGKAWKVPFWEAQDWGEGGEGGQNISGGIVCSGRTAFLPDSLWILPLVLADQGQVRDIAKEFKIGVKCQAIARRIRVMKEERSWD